MEETKEWPIDRFLKWVAEIVRNDDRGTLAELRRGLSETTQDRAWEHVIPYCSDFAENENHRFVWCTIGGLAATLMPKGLGLSVDESRNNLGTVMRSLARGKGDGDKDALKSFEPRFRRLLSCADTRSLCEMVVGIGRAAVVKGISVNLKSLFWDLWNWDDSDRREKTRLQWSKRYFSVIVEKSDIASSKEEDAE